MVKKISYAASFGRTVIPERHHHEVALYSEALDSISVREASGSSMLKRLLDRESHLVPDPTFLIDWSSIDTQRLSQGKLFSYVLRSGDGLYDFQRELGEELDLDVIQPLNPHQRWKSYGEIIPMSPMEWLEAIQRSSAVVTNSFHGTVFAILFNRPFLSVKLGGAKSVLNERMYHLLTSLDLISRQISLGDRKSAVTRMNQPIDWKHVNKRVATMKASGVDFLSVAMGG
jgi:exopolysaccharide biosynthesis predicted pyruvyltransferase EpsI